MPYTTRKVSDLHVVGTQVLASPAEMGLEIARSDAEADFVADSRDVIHRILQGTDPRFLVIVGPCSIHDPESCREYAEKLSVLSRELEDKLFVVMRVYFEKPRTSIGWKGLVMDPHLDGSYDIDSGLRLARRILREVIDLGLPTATEFLDPITPQYISDLVSWSAIGARTSESQTHRQMASGLSMPVGIKNSTYGDIQAAINGIKAATHSQSFLGVDAGGRACAVSTSGNPDCHIILRGGTQGPNYQASELQQAQGLLSENGLPDRVIVDASHANCGKDHERMPAVFRDILQQRVAGNRMLVGAMLESNLVAGAQSFPRPLEDLVYGQSITDKCMNWETTEALLREAHTLL